jgi:hypothetical protein
MPAASSLTPSPLTARRRVANGAACLAAVYDAPEASRLINKHYASFFLPFWREHVLLRGVLDPAEHKRIVDGLGSP